MSALVQEYKLEVRKLGNNGLMLFFFQKSENVLQTSG